MTHKLPFPENQSCAPHQFHKNHLHNFFKKVSEYLRVSDTINIYNFLLKFNQ